MSAPKSSSTASAIPSAINATTSASDLLQILMDMSSNVTHESVIDAIEALPSDDNTVKIGILAYGCATNVRKIMLQVQKATNIALPDAWMIDGEINFSMLAMAGHIMFLLPDSCLTTDGLKAKEKYQTAIFGKKNILEVDATVNAAGKEERLKILTQWADRVKGVDTKRAFDVYSKKFTLTVRSTRLADPLKIPKTLLSSFLKVLFMPTRFIWSLRFYLLLSTVLFSPARTVYISVADLGIFMAYTPVKSIGTMAVKSAFSAVGLDIGPATDVFTSMMASADARLSENLDAYVASKDYLVKATSGISKRNLISSTTSASAQILKDLTSMLAGAITRAYEEATAEEEVPKSEEPAEAAEEATVEEKAPEEAAVEEPVSEDGSFLIDILSSEGVSGVNAFLLTAGVDASIAEVKVGGPFGYSEKNVSDIFKILGLGKAEVCEAAEEVLAISPLGPTSIEKAVATAAAKAMAC